MANLYNDIKYALMNQIKFAMANNNTITKTEDFLDDTYVIDRVVEVGSWERSDGTAPNGSTGYIDSGLGVHGATKDTTFNVNIPPGKIVSRVEVDWQVSSEPGFDFFIILVDDVEVFRESGIKQGTHSQDLTPGAHTVTLRYTKDGADTMNDDKAYVSEIRVVYNSEIVDVYPVYYQNIPMFPAVSIQTERRRKIKKGVGKISEIELEFNVWTYVKIADFEDAEAECMRLTELVEEAIESDKTLGGVTMYLTIDQDLDFGVVETNDGIFLQGSKILLTVKKRVQG